MFWVAAIPFVLTTWIVGYLAAMNNMSMVDEINGSPARQVSFSYVGWHPGKASAVKVEHQRLFPDSDRPKRSKRYIATILIALAYAVTVMLIGSR